MPLMNDDQMRDEELMCYLDEEIRLARGEASRWNLMLAKKLYQTTVARGETKAKLLTEEAEIARLTARAEALQGVLRVMKADKPEGAQ